MWGRVCAVWGRVCGVRCGKVYLWGGCIHEGVCGGVDWDHMV
jgi:hypothetical protein